MKNILLSIVAGLVILAGAWFWFNSNKEAQDVKESGTPAVFDSGEVKTFQIEASNFKYNLGEIRVKQGDKVKIVLNVREGFHDFVLDEFNVVIKSMQAGGVGEAEFVADNKGQFEYYCSVGTHRQMGMVGVLVVE